MGSRGCCARFRWERAIPLSCRGLVASAPMLGRLSMSRIKPRIGAGLAVLCIGGAAMWSAGPAGAASAGHTHGKKSHSGLPEVGNATELSKEPVIHAGKGRPPTKLLTKNLVVGSGTAVTSGSSVSVKYVGANYANGKDFTTSTWQSGQATTFSLAHVVPGFADGLVGMKVGGRREIVIPPALGYGQTADGPIRANETLVFVVDLEGVSS